ncbi:hypothetical protein RFI_16823 [Reticulomyxa filosa]|uniref:Uncharacterized protein n=1 Tax=Reticulomyxa filosa TaxID=46433 RepID=X6N3T9_RETFI|nr:hypothetical protein RFI_16823 [Reticulomyxa filosa]|eukprot:ETO20394.1 hypothetical protein RFI_16823 [Reticulomyxa filosa]
MTTEYPVLIAHHCYQIYQLFPLKLNIRKLAKDFMEQKKKLCSNSAEIDISLITEMQRVQELSENAKQDIRGIVMKQTKCKLPEQMDRIAERYNHFRLDAFETIYWKEFRIPFNTVYKGTIADFFEGFFDKLFELRKDDDDKDIIVAAETYLFIFKKKNKANRSKRSGFNAPLSIAVPKTTDEGEPYEDLDENDTRSRDIRVNNTNHNNTSKQMSLEIVQKHFCFVLCALIGLYSELIVTPIQPHPQKIILSAWIVFVPFFKIRLGFLKKVTTERTCNEVSWQIYVFLRKLNLKKKLKKIITSHLFSSIDGNIYSLCFHWEQNIYQVRQCDLVWCLV